MATLSLFLLGPFTATFNDQPLQNFKTNKAQALLIYLAVEKDRSHHRESLMEFLWPDIPRQSAQVNLQQTVDRLRQAIPEVQSADGSGMIPLIDVDRQSVSLNPQAAVQVDVLDFQAALMNDPVKAVSLYRGNFLEDFRLVDSDRFEAWAQGIRENLRHTALSALDGLVETCLAEGDYTDAQTYAWRQLEIDPLRERAYRQLMTAMSSSGQNNAAISLYQLCRNRLAKELGLEPSLETTQLYEQIQAEALRQTRKPEPKPKPAGEGMPVFLLTDIEGSTRLWDTHRQDMLPALLQHNQILEACITRNGGRILELRGDGVKAVFEGVNPLQCMLDIQQSLGTADWGEIGDLRIRIGLHGVPTVREGFDYFIEDEKYYGPVLNHTSRIMDAGHGGQILVSEEVHQKCNLPPGASWQDFGRHKVKSLDHPIQIYGLLHPDLPLQSFPPLRTRAAQASLEPEEAALEGLTPFVSQGVKIRHNLPPQPTPLIGRVNELAELDQLIAKPETRLVTITGAGGMGKTRFAVAWAERQLAQKDEPEAHIFENGIFFVPLADIDNPDQIPKEIAAALDLELKPSGNIGRIGGGADPKQLINDFLASRNILLVLDNFEQINNGGALLTELLQTAPGLKLLVTSRERLNLQYEQVFPIGGLAFPADKTTRDPGDYSAIQLFLERAGRVRPDFKLDTDDLANVTLICQLVDGMPLGLELATSWVDLLSVGEIARELKKSIEFLETELVDLPERHRSLAAVCNSSWAYLSDQEQDHFAHLSVFRGGFTRTAAQQVVGTSLRTLGTLVKKSLLQFDPQAERYRFHPYLRQFAAGRLAKNPEDETIIRDMHSAYFCEELGLHKNTFDSGRPHVAIEYIEQDFDNIQAAWKWAIKNEKFKLIYKAIDAICNYYESMIRGDLQAINLCKSALDVLLEAKDSIPRESILYKRLQVKINLWMGYFSIYEQREQAAHFFEQAIEIIDQLDALGIDVREEKCIALVYQGLLEHWIGNHNRVKVLCKEAITLSKAIGLKQMTLLALGGMGFTAEFLGLPYEAVTWFQQYLTEARAQGNHWAEMMGLRYLGMAWRLQNDYVKASSFYEESIELAQKHHHRIELTSSLLDQAGLSLLLGHFNRAKVLNSQALDEIREYEPAFTWILPLTQLGVTTWLLGEFEQAKISMAEALSIGEQSARSYRTWSTTLYAEYMILVGRYHTADQLLDMIENKADGMTYNLYHAARNERILGWTALVKEEYTRGRPKLEKSIEISRKMSDMEATAWTQPYLALTHYRLGDRAQALELLIEALSSAIRIQAYIPMVFALPVSLLFLAEDNLEFAIRIYKKVRRDPFMSNAQLFHDLVYKHLPEELKAIQVETVKHSDEHLEALWETARSVYTYLAER